MGHDADRPIRTVLKQAKEPRRVPSCACPTCGAKLDAVSVAYHVEPGDDFDPGDTIPMPEPGDLTVCGHCSAVLRFGPGLVVFNEPNPPEELRPLSGFLTTALRGRTQ